MGRMKVNHRLGLRNGLVDFEMEEYLAGARLSSGNLLSVEIDEANIGGREVVLAYQRGRANYLVGAEAKGDVAAVAVDVLAQP